MPPNSGVRQRNSLNDIKSLRAQYRQALPSLTELFPDWSHNDLLFVMDECQGDLDLAITRISEGHANQWGQVKSKKPKPKPSSAQLNHKKSNHKSSSNNTTPTSTANALADGKALGNNSKSKNNGKHHKSKRNNSKKDKVEKEVVEKEEDEEEKKPSWASIAKGPTKPEVMVQPMEDSPSEAPPILTAREEKKVEVDNTMVKQLVDHIQEEVVEQVLEQITDKAIEQAVDQLNTHEPETLAAIVEEEPNAEPVVIAEPVVLAEPVVVSNTTTTTTTTIRKPTIRRLKQTEPVILPNNQQADLPSVNVQFGSLNLANGEEMSRDENEEAVEETAIIENIAKQAPQPLEEITVDVTPSPSPAPTIAQISEQAKPKETPIVATAATAATNTTTSSVVSNGLASFHNIDKPLPEPFHPQQQPAHIQPQQQQAVQPQPTQPHVYTEPYSMNPYATYVANIHNSVAGYSGGIPPDYYSADPQRMAYYDTSFYGHSPLMNGGANGHLFARDRYNTLPPHPPMEMMNQTPPPPPPHLAQQYPHPHSHPAHHAPPPPPPVPQAQNHGYYPLSYQQQQQQQQTQPPPQQPYVNKSMYNAAIPINKYDYSAYEDYYHQQQQLQQQQQQQQQNHDIMYTSNNHPAPSAPRAHPPFQQLYQPQQPQPPRQPYWH
ncbi:uncharacterized protein ATC70_004907 [Mucor velutinosus]|uniref:RNA polymerase II degradation factor 1 n=1 Tax=Mucor velutinosus TaxID=708070 RepID=A0AAN7D4Y0_9FUNG|nr:hypothetical protein ATC70_004907 [Mucor velutinosus]